MPLIDHFHPPLKGRRRWESFHGLWAAAMLDSLNEHVLPPEYFAEFQVHVGGLEIDVATFEDLELDRPDRGDASTATVAAPAWAPPAPAMTAPALFPDDIEVQVFSETGTTLVAAIELVSPGNKDRDLARRAFTSKCDAYLQRGIGLIVVDIVTERRGNLHDELMILRGAGDEYLIASSPALYAVAYRPVRRPGSGQLEIWPISLAVGKAMPTLPLALRDGPTLPLDLESTYTDALRRGRIVD
jgi:hypothetical protein